MTVKQQIIAHEYKLLKAIKDSDTFALDKLLHDDLLFITPTGQLLNKKTDLDHYNSGQMRVFSLEFSEQQLQSYDGELAVVTLKVALNASFADQIIDGVYRYIRVWKFAANSWKVIAGSGVKIV